MRSRDAMAAYCTVHLRARPHPHYHPHPTTKELPEALVQAGSTRCTLFPLGQDAPWDCMHAGATWTGCTLGLDLGCTLVQMQH